MKYLAQFLLGQKLSSHDTTSDDVNYCFKYTMYISTMNLFNYMQFSCITTARKWGEGNKWVQ